MDDAVSRPRPCERDLLAVIIRHVSATECTITVPVYDPDDVRWMRTAASRRYVSVTRITSTDLYMLSRSVESTTETATATVTKEK